MVRHMGAAKTSYRYHASAPNLNKYARNAD